MPDKKKFITVIGGGLAGSEAAWQAARRGWPVRLIEMRPLKKTPAHETGGFAELVCSNSLRSNAADSAIGLLKNELRCLGSLIMTAADATKVPAGSALAVDREKFSAHISEKISAHPLITVDRAEIKKVPSAESGPVIIATGPLTSDSLAADLGLITGTENLSFYDAIAPIVAADSLDYDKVYRASRYDDGPGDYLNCPMDRDEYERFITALAAADRIRPREFEDPKYFEGCLPIEVMLERGDDTPRFGPMKPVGLPDPRTGRDNYAVVQLRSENLDNSAYNLVGFQTRITYTEQQKVFRLIPGLERADFLRFGSVHRNTFVRAPKVLAPGLELAARPGVMLAGQVSGVEGYIESCAMGMLAGIFAAGHIRGKPVPPVPEGTALGALLNHLYHGNVKKFQPSNINFGLFPPLGQRLPKKMRGARRTEIAQKKLEDWIIAESTIS